MITQVIAAAREDMVIRALLDRAELRERCLEVLRAQTRAGNLETALAAAAPRGGALRELPDEPEAER